MKNFKTMTLALGLSSMFALGACGGGDLDEAKKFADELCACKDAACVEKVNKKAEKSMSEEKMKKLTKEKPEEMAKLGVRIGECTMKHHKMPPPPAE
ncbi:MAG: hypothetical protein GY811_28770 [Myxococcales bacterium]|nr:hypothetical protein [Myxococcales bacterium]